MIEWMPIETAPKDGTGPLLGFADGVQFTMIWRLPGWFGWAGFQPRSEGGWVAHAYGLICYTGSGRLIELKPTHWMPLPEPPKENTNDS